MLDHVPDDGHDLSGELPLLQPEGGAGRVGVLQPVRQEHVVGRHLREQGQPEARDDRDGESSSILYNSVDNIG